MTHKSLFSLVVFTFLSLFSNAQEIGFPIIRNYTPKEFNGTPQVLSAIQDNRGVMYFGCGSSLLEYDGVSWRNISNSKHARFLDFAMDKCGKIYVSALDDFGYLKIDKKGNTQYQSLTHLIADTTHKIGFVWTIKITSKFVYFISYDAIFQYSPDSDKIAAFEPDSNDGFLDGFVYKDILYVQLFNNGLIKLENGEIKQAIQSKFFKNKNFFRAALPFNDHSLLIPTRTEGLYIYQPEKDTTLKPFTLSNNDFILDNNIYNASLFQKENFVLASINKGTLLFDRQGKILQQYKENNLLQNNTVRVVMADTSQNLWMGLDNGISKTDHRLDLSYWDKNSGLKGIAYNVIRFNGTIYISTSLKIYFINKNNQLQEVKNIPVGQNWCFLEYKENNSLLAGSRYGIYEIKGDSATLIFAGTHFAKLYPSIKNPKRIFSSALPDFISIRFDAGKWIYEGKWAGINDEVRGMIEDENGDLWLGTYRNGVIRITPNNEDITKPKKIQYYKKKDGFASLVDILPFQVKNSIIWGSDKGLYSYNPKIDRFEPFCDLGIDFCNGSRSVYSLKEMPDGKIWICPKENKGEDIGYLQPNNKGGYDWVYAPFRRIPGMFLEAFYVEPTGIAWIGGSEGLYKYNMQQDTKHYNQDFNCLIRRISIATDSTIYGGNYADTTLTVLKYRFNDLKFEFAAPFFDQEEKTFYSHKLQGYDKEWSKWTRQTQKEYTNLSEGTYTFQVKARNVYDIESKTNTYKIVILPPFYRTWWAYSIYLILVILFIIIVLKYYTRHLIEQKEHLKQLVNEGTAEILQQKNKIQAHEAELLAYNEELMATNDELKKQREELETTLQALKKAQIQLIQSEKMASLGLLASGVAHEINNPLNFIQGGVNGIEHYFEENSDKHKSNIELFINAIKEGVSRAVEIVSGLSHFSRNGNNVFRLIDVHTVINNCLLMLQNKTRERIEIIKDYTNSPYTLCGNESNLHQATLNVITNAVQAIHDKGTIAITTTIVGENIIISFTDTGCGISEENLLKITDPFFTTMEPGKGTGLGLFITFNIIKEHNGTIEFESKLGKGTTVIIKLPVNTLVKE